MLRAEGLVPSKKVATVSGTLIQEIPRNGDVTRHARERGDDQD